MASQAKKETRRLISKLIGRLTPDARAEKSGAACRKLLAIPEVREARAVLLYSPLPDELDTGQALRALIGAGKRVFLPKCRRETHELLCIEIEDLERDLITGTYNIAEPKSDRGVNAGDLDVVVLPGRAFDRDGNRVGRGAGYYDRFLARPELRAFKCGIAFDCQVLPGVPADSYDVLVDAIVTESGLIRVGGSPGVAAEESAARHGDAAQARENDQGG